LNGRKAIYHDIGAFELPPLLMLNRNRLNLMRINQGRGVGLNQTRRFTSSSGRLAKEIVESKASSQNTQVTVAQKAVAAGKATSYVGIVLLGVGLLGGLLYFLLSELFSTSSPGAIYDKSANLAKNHPDVQELLGTPLKAYGEGRRREHPAYQYLEQDGKLFLLMKFYITGPKGTGTVSANLREVSKGRFEYVALVVEVGSRRIFLERNPDLLN